MYFKVSVLKCDKKQLLYTQVAFYLINFTLSANMVLNINTWSTLDTSRFEVHFKCTFKTIRHTYFSRYRRDKKTRKLS